MTPEQLTKISKAMDKARGDETPFAVYDPKTDEMAVYGDANKTDNKAMDVLITFRFNKQEFEELGFPKDMATETIGDNLQLNAEFKDVSITPRNNSKLIEYMLSIIPFFENLSEAWEGMKEAIDKAESPDEKAKATIERRIAMYRAFNESSDEAQLAMYNLVATLCSIPDNLAAHMLSNNVIEAVGEIFYTYPELVNEAETLFGYSRTGMVMA